MSRPRALGLSTTALGDTLLSTPIIANLAKVFDLDLVVHRRNLGLMKNNPHVKQVFSYRSNDLTRLWLSLRLCRRRYQRVLVLHSNADVLRLLPLLRYEQAANIQGWQKPALRLVNLPPDPGEHVVLKRMHLARWAGAPDKDGPMQVFLSQQELAKGRDWLASLAPTGGPWVALCPGASHEYKRWPAERFGEVARELGGQGCRVLVVGAKNEAALARRVQRAAGIRLHQALGLDLRLFCTVLAGCRLLITNDTGPMHLAQALGIATLAIFGPTDVATLGPRKQPFRVLETAPVCQRAQCLKRSCQRPDCLEAITVQEVLAAARELLAETGA